MYNSSSGINHPPTLLPDSSTNPNECLSGGKSKSSTDVSFTSSELQHPPSPSDDVKCVLDRLSSDSEVPVKVIYSYLTVYCPLVVNPGSLLPEVNAHSDTQIHIDTHVLSELSDRIQSIGQGAQKFHLLSVSPAPLGQIFPILPVSIRFGSKCQAFVRQVDVVAFYFNFTGEESVFRAEWGCKFLLDRYTPLIITGMPAGHGNTSSPISETHSAYLWHSSGANVDMTVFERRIHLIESFLEAYSPKAWSAHAPHQSYGQPAPDRNTFIDRGGPYSCWLEEALEGEIWHCRFVPKNVVLPLPFVSDTYKLSVEAREYKIFFDFTRKSRGADYPWPADEGDGCLITFESKIDVGRLIAASE